MKFIDIDHLNANKERLKADWQKHHDENKFGYFVLDGFFSKEEGDKLYDNYPVLADLGKGTRTYLNGKGKYQMTTFEDAPLMGEVLDELNSAEFLKHMEEITGIDQLMGDADLFGGGLHQSVNGAYLNVHIDFNMHPKNSTHRRMNIIIYMNKDWDDAYQGHLELWNMETKTMLEKVPPLFNRCVVFETNEFSYHGHPKPLATPEGRCRNSFAAYYYTKDRPEHEKAAEHSTVYVNTEGTGGVMKRLKSGIQGLKEKVFKKS